MTLCQEQPIKRKRQSEVPVTLCQESAHKKKIKKIKKINKKKKKKLTIFTGFLDLVISLW